ncbi:MAG: methylated-DNA--[protein]-cysteine S-methyltransferase [Candidatus Binataceae bacterium]
MQNLTLRRERVSSVLGEILVLTDEQDRIRVLDFEDDADRIERLLRLRFGEVTMLDLDDRSPSKARRAIENYFAGNLSALDDLEVETGGTAFQREVWAALRKIPAGQTRTYGELAAQINRSKAVRAVGLANGANPVAIVVPCHRVIGADGSLTGYGGGLPRKRWLLAHEGAELALDKLK